MNAGTPAVLRRVVLLGLLAKSASIDGSVAGVPTAPDRRREPPLSTQPLSGLGGSCRLLEGDAVTSGPEPRRGLLGVSPEADDPDPRRNWPSGFE